MYNNQPEQSSEITVNILVIEDNDSDIYMIEESMREYFFVNSIYYANSYSEARDQLKSGLVPDIIFVDINMPELDGFETITKLKDEFAELEYSSFVISSSSGAQKDLQRAEEVGVTSYVKKPLTFLKLVEVAKSLGGYGWLLSKLTPKEQAM